MSVPVGSHPLIPRAGGRLVAALAALAIAASFLVLGAAPATSAGPEITLDPTSGLPGSSVKVTGSGWPKSAGPVSRSSPRPTLCEIAWVVDLPAVQPCEFTEDGLLKEQTLVTPVDAAPGPREVKVCMPSCDGIKEQASATFTVLPAPVRVPDLHGQSYPEAVVSLESLGLSIDPSTSPDDPTATISDQDPDAETLVDAGSTVSVTYTVVAPTEQVTVPNLVGLTRKAATAAVRPGGLLLAVDPAGTRTGRVQTQRPRAGRLVDRGSTVSVFLVRAPAKLVAVPDVTGLSVADARARIEAANLILRIDETRAGVVEQQVPAAGTLVRQGSTVGVQLVAVTSDADRSRWWLVALGALVFLLGGAASAFVRRVRRRGPRWMHTHVEVRPQDAAPKYDADDDPPVHTVRLVPEQGEQRTEVLEVHR